MQQTFNTGVQLGISIHERKIVYASEHNKPIEIDGKVYWIESDIQHLRKIMDRVRICLILMKVVCIQLLNMKMIFQ